MAERAERTQRRNPHELTVRPHVFPLKSIARFAERGVVDLYDMVRGRRRPARPDDTAFCAARAWNHGAEHGFMKAIEDAFQKLIDWFSPGDRPAFDSSQAEIINEFLGLWSSRSHWRRLSRQVMEAGRDVLGARAEYSDDELELLERNGIGAVRKDGSIAVRDIVPLKIRLDVDRTRTAMAGRQWGLLTAAEGEFCVPDRPRLAFIPISPSLMLAADGPSECVDGMEVANINREQCDGAEDFVFARSLDACPGLPLRMQASKI